MTITKTMVETFLAVIEGAYGVAVTRQPEEVTKRTGEIARWLMNEERVMFLREFGHGSALVQVVCSDRRLVNAVEKLFAEYVKEATEPKPEVIDDE